MKLTTQHIIIGILVLVCISLGLGLGISFNGNTRKNEKIEQYKDSIFIINSKIDVLEENKEKLEYDLKFSYEKYRSLYKQYDKLKKKKDEKIDSVANLNNHSTYIFISKWLSERDSTKR